MEQKLNKRSNANFRNTRIILFINVTAEYELITH